MSLNGIETKDDWRKKIDELLELHRHAKEIKVTKANRCRVLTICIVRAPGSSTGKKFDNKIQVEYRGHPVPFTAAIQQCS